MGGPIGAHPSFEVGEAGRGTTPVSDAEDGIFFQVGRETLEGLIVASAGVVGVSIACIVGG